MLPATLSPNSFLPPRIKSELDLVKPVARGAKGLPAKRVQEWLTLNGYGLVIDGDFGPATEDQVKAFQRALGQPANGIVDAATWTALVDPLVKAIAPAGASGSLSPRVAEVAKHHVAQHPREAGGDNCGPWVRAYLGWDGAEARWCAGFTCTVLEQAAALLDAKPPIKSSASCDTVADRAKIAGKFIPGPKTPPTAIAPGSFFLVRASPTDWTHVGIVLQAGPDSFSTFEGNTNDQGSANGYEACQRRRDYKRKDFVIW